MKAFRFFSLLVILLAVLFVACALGGDEPPAVPEDGGEPGAGEEEPATVEITPAGTVTDEVTHGGPIEDYVSLVDALRFTGATVEPVEGVDQPFFKPQAQVVEVKGEAVQIFEFADEEAASAAAATVAEDGSSVGTTMLTWQDTPHFYRVDRLIVLYVGSDQEGAVPLTRSAGQVLHGRLNYDRSSSALLSIYPGHRLRSQSLARFGRVE